MSAHGIPRGPRTVFLSRDVSRPVLAGGRKAGRVVRIAKGVWSADTHTPPTEIVAANLWFIIRAYCPDAIVVDRTAARGGLVDGGVVTIATDSRTTSFELPGVVVLVRPRVEHPTDTPWAEGLTGSAPARALVDNLAESRGRNGRPGRTLTRPELQDWVAVKRMTWGSTRLRRLEEQAVEIADDLDQDPAAVRELFASVEGGRDAPSVRGAFARAALHGTAWDEQRVTMFANAARQLSEVESRALTVPRVDGEFPFYEAYFSNYIEGTEFTIAEAREIVETQTPPARRSADGHDILGTHRCVVDPIGRAATGSAPDEMIDLLRTRHRTLMVGRPDIGPGEFKEDVNRAGTTEFVDPNLTLGTLLRSLEMAKDVPPGLPRAIYLMVVVAEVHPFTDGNGRAGRLMMNAEMSAVGACRIIVPTVLRNEYVAALKRFSNRDGDVAALVQVLTWALRWSSAMPWQDRAAVDAQMEATNATLDPNDAAREGRHLLLP
jgi:hypothetical protein